MKINDKVHLIRQYFNVTPQVKRYVNIYLIEGEFCYLVDCGVAGAGDLISEYMDSINRKMSDIRAIFATHSHPDHIGAAAEIQAKTDCNIYAPFEELSWIEDINEQYKKRPIPNFYNFLPKSVSVSSPLKNGDIVGLEKDLKINAISTKGHSHGSMSYVLNDNIIFSGDAIPTLYDLPIFVDYEESIDTLDKLSRLENIEWGCPAWDEPYDCDSFKKALSDSKSMLIKLKENVLLVEQEFVGKTEEEKNMEIYKRSNLLEYLGNPLVAISIAACKKQ